MNLTNYDELNELWTMNCYELNCDMKCCEGSKVLCCMCAWTYVVNDENKEL